MFRRLDFLLIFTFILQASSLRLGNAINSGHEPPPDENDENSTKIHRETLTMELFRRINVTEETDDDNKTEFSPSDKNNYANCLLIFGEKNQTNYVCDISRKFLVIWSERKRQLRETLAKRLGNPTLKNVINRIKGLWGHSVRKLKQLIRAKRGQTLHDDVEEPGSQNDPQQTAELEDKENSSPENTQAEKEEKGDEEKKEDDVSGTTPTIDEAEISTEKADVVDEKVDDKIDGNEKEETSSLTEPDVANGDVNQSVDTVDKEETARPDDVHEQVEQHGEENEEEEDDEKVVGGAETHEENEEDEEEETADAESPSEDQSDDVDTEVDKDDEKVPSEEGTDDEEEDVDETSDEDEKVDEEAVEEDEQDESSDESDDAGDDDENDEESDEGDQEEEISDAGEEDSDNDTDDSDTSSEESEDSDEDNEDEDQETEDETGDETESEETEESDDEEDEDSELESEQEYISIISPENIWNFLVGIKDLIVDTGDYLLSLLFKNMKHGLRKYRIDDKFEKQLNLLANSRNVDSKKALEILLKKIRQQFGRSYELELVKFLKELRDEYLP